MKPNHVPRLTREHLIHKPSLIPLLHPMGSCQKVTPPDRNAFIRETREDSPDGGIFSGQGHRSVSDPGDLQPLYSEFDRDLSQRETVQNRSGRISFPLSPEISLIPDSGKR